MNRFIFFCSLVLLVILGATMQIKMVELFQLTPLFVLGTLIACSFFLPLLDFLCLLSIGMLALDWQYGIDSSTIMLFGSTVIIFFARKIVPLHPWFRVVILTFCASILLGLLEGVSVNLSLLIVAFATSFYALIIFSLLHDGCRIPIQS